MKMAVFGLGEAGSLIAQDLARAGVAVTGFDPASVQTPVGVTRVQCAQQAVMGADIIIALTAGTDALQAITQAQDDIARTAVYADFSTNSAAAKTQLADIASRSGFDFVDVALMTVVPGKGLRTPVMVSGTGADKFSTVFSTLGMPVDVVEGDAGAAATRKLLRSVMMKGLAAVIIEAMRAGEAAGCTQWLWRNLIAELTAADEQLISRLVAGTKAHAVRRLHEMQCSQQLLEQLGVDPLMTRATVESLRRVPEQGLPTLNGCEQ